VILCEYECECDITRARVDKDATTVEFVLKLAAVEFDIVVVAFDIELDNMGVECELRVVDRDDIGWANPLDIVPT